MKNSSRRLTFLPLVVLITVTLACGSLPALPTAGARASATPRPTRTPRPAATAAPKRTATPPAVVSTAQPTPAAAFDDPAQFKAALRPEFAADVDLFPSATRYFIEMAVTFNADGSATLIGRERLRYTNQQSFALEDIYLMLWPNDTASEQYLSRAEMSHVLVNEAAVEPEWDANGVAARLALAEPLAPGASVDVSAEFKVDAYGGVEASGAKRFGMTNGVLLAPTFYPLIPRMVDGKWQTRSAPPAGDTTNSDTAFYVWQVTAPADMLIVGSGTVVDSSTADDVQTQTLVTGPMRDLALVVGPLELTQRTVDGITLNAYMLAEHASDAKTMLDYTEGQVKVLEAAVGPYPFAELDVVDAPGTFGGIEYPGLVFIGVVGEGEFFEYATVHEVGHQWFYSVVGSDQLLEPWLDEALTSYTEVLYFEKSGSARAVLDWFRTELDYVEDQTQPIGLPVEDYVSEDDYGIIVYDKGGLFFDALRRKLGDKTFFTFLKSYYSQYRYGFATAADFQAAAEQTCGCDLKAMFDLWVYKGGPMK